MCCASCKMVLYRLNFSFILIKIKHVQHFNIPLVFLLVFFLCLFLDGFVPVEHPWMCRKSSWEIFNFFLFKIKQSSNWNIIWVLSVPKGQKCRWRKTKEIKSIKKTQKVGSINWVSTGESNTGNHTDRISYKEHEQNLTIKTGNNSNVIYWNTETVERWLENTVEVRIRNTIKTESKEWIKNRNIKLKT